MACTQEVVFDANLIQNSTLEDGLAGWAPLGSCTALSVHNEEPAKVPTETINSVGDDYQPSGRYILAAGRADEKDGLWQAISGALKPRITYRVAGWISLGDGAEEGGHAVLVNLRMDDDDCLVEGGAVCAEAGKWTEIKGAFRLKTSPCGAAVYVQGAPAGVDVKVMDLQIFATDRKARFRKLKKKTDKVRKRDVVLKFGGAGAASGISGASIRVMQMDSSFPFGACINGGVIQNPAFVDFFTKHFDWAVFENELKWYWTEAQEWQLNYNDADALLDFCDRYGKPVRGHCIFWAVDNVVQQWIKNLDNDQLMSAVESRLQSLLTRYAGRFPPWGNVVTHNNSAQQDSWDKTAVKDTDMQQDSWGNVATQNIDAQNDSWKCVAAKAQNSTTQQGSWDKTAVKDTDMHQDSWGDVATQNIDAQNDSWESVAAKGQSSTQQDSWGNVAASPSDNAWNAAPISQGNRDSDAKQSGCYDGWNSAQGEDSSTDKWNKTNDSGNNKGWKSDGWGAKTGNWRGQRNDPGRPQRKPDERGPPRRLFELTSEEEKILAEINPIVQSIRKIFRESCEGVRLSPEDEKFIKENVLEHHPEKQSKVSGEIDHIMVDKHQIFQESRCLFVVSSDGTCSDFSYLKCMENYVRKAYTEHGDSFCKKYFKRRREQAATVDGGTTPVTPAEAPQSTAVIEQGTQQETHLETPAPPVATPQETPAPPAATQQETQKPDSAADAGILGKGPGLTD